MVSMGSHKVIFEMDCKIVVDDARLLWMMCTLKNQNDPSMFDIA
jgi:hypothetical protein